VGVACGRRGSCGGGLGGAGRRLAHLVVGIRLARRRCGRPFAHIGEQLAAGAVRCRLQVHHRQHRRHGCGKRQCHHAACAQRQDGGVDRDLRRLVGARHIQRRAQREHAQALRVRVDGEVERLVLEAGGAGHVDHRVLRIDHEGARLRQAVAHGKVAGGAVDVDLLVAEQLGEDHVADVQPHRLQDELADGAALHQDFQLAVGRAEQRRHRVAGGRQARVAVDLAHAGLHRFDLGEQLLDAEMPRRQRRAGLHRRGLAVELEVGGERAAGHAKVERIEREHGVLQLDVRDEVVDGQVGAVNDAFAAELHVGVDGVPAVGTEGLDRQHLVGGLAHGVVAGFGALGLARVGIGADDGGQVGEQQLMRDQLAGELRALVRRLAHGEGERAAQVGAAHATGELLVAQVCALLAQLADQAAARVERRRLRQHDAGQRIELRQARARQVQAQVQRRQARRVGERAGQVDARLAHRHVGLQRVGPLGILQAQHAAGLAGAADGGVVVGALDRPGDAVGLLRIRRDRGVGSSAGGGRHHRRLLGALDGGAVGGGVERLVVDRVDGGGQVDALDVVVQLQRSLAEGDLAQFELPVGGRVAVTAGQLEGPVVAVLLVAL